MIKFLTVFLCVQGCIFGIETDFDVAVIGTSPVCLLEAIHHIANHEKVLILEEDQQCGGAWKAIDICGIEHVDLGCHLIGSDARLKQFFEAYFGCQFVCLEHPKETMQNTHLSCPNGFYFSGGCYELISTLERTILSKQNAQLLHKKVESIYFDPGKEYVELSLGDTRYSAKRLYIPQMCRFRVENPAVSNQEYPKHLYHHLYMLIEDATPFRFTYLNGIAPGMSRAMNLTPFVSFPHEGLQMIVIQTHANAGANDSQKFLEAFKGKGLLSNDARILLTDTYIYQQGNMNQGAFKQIAGNLVEVLDTSSFGGMVRYLDRWKTSLIPLQ